MDHGGTWSSLPRWKPPGPRRRLRRKPARARLSTKSWLLLLGPVPVPNQAAPQFHVIEGIVVLDGGGSVRRPPLPGESRLGQHPPAHRAGEARHELASLILASEVPEIGGVRGRGIPPSQLDLDLGARLDGLEVAAYPRTDVPFASRQIARERRVVSRPRATETATRLTP